MPRSPDCTWLETSRAAVSDSPRVSALPSLPGCRKYFGPCFFQRRMLGLVSPAEFHVFAPGVEPVASRVGRGKHLQRHGALHFRVALRGGLQDIIGAAVHHHKLSAVEETDAVSAGLQDLTGDFERDFVQ